MTETTMLFHAAPSGWIAVYGHNHPRVPIAGFLVSTGSKEGPNDLNGALGKAVIYDPDSGALVDAAEWGRRNDAVLRDICQEIPRRSDREYDKWGDRWPAYDADRLLDAVELLAEKMQGIADAVLRAGE